MDKAFVGQKVYAQLLKAEAAMDAAQLEYANLLKVMIEARIEASVSPVSVEAEFNNVAKAIDGLNVARSATVGLHNGLGRLAKVLRVPVRMNGIPIMKPAMETDHQRAEASNG